MKKIKRNHFQFQRFITLLQSEVGIIYLSGSSKKEILKTLETKNLEFFHLTECNSFVYLYKKHPLAEKESISIDELANYQFVTYDKNDLTSFFSDDFLQSHQLTQSITVADQATALSLLKSLNGYTFLSGITGDKGDEDFITVPIKNIDSGIRQNFELGYITQKKQQDEQISMLLHLYNQKDSSSCRFCVLESFLQFRKLLAHKF